jgi:integral membrane protein (TIGR00529 family)
MFDWVESIPVLVRVLLSLGVILVLSRRFHELLWPLVAGTVTLVLLSGHGAWMATEIARDRIFSTDNLLLLVALTLVIWLSSQMSSAGLLRDLVDAVRQRMSRRSAMAMLPAVIGLLPMPGGALFSAPLVDECDSDRTMASMSKTQVNYWFRHVWEFWWPLYPGVLLAIALTGVDMGHFILMQLPLTAIALGVGWLTVLRRLPVGEPVPKATTGEVGESLGAAWWGPMMPIAVTVGVYALVKIFLPMVAAWSHYLPMAIGLLVAIAVVQGWRPIPLAAWRDIVLSRRVLGLILIVEVVRVYGAFIEARLPGGMLLVEQMRGELAHAHIPTMAVVMAIPFLCGLSTGLSIGYVGASFPIVLHLVDPSAGVGGFAATCVLAYGFGYYGMILSPVHVCLIVTNRHFETSLIHSLRGLVLPSMAALAGIGLYAWLLYVLL